MLDVEGKTVIVSGASQGLGRSLALKLHARGANVVLVARTASKLQELADSLNENRMSSNQQAYAYPLDLSIKEDVLEFGKWLDDRVDNLVGVFCCAGSSIPKLFTNLSLDEIDNGININYKTCIYLLHVTIPLLKRSKEKTNIVIFSSSVAFYSFIGQELDPYNINVSTVFPGNFASEGFHEENLTKPAITSQIEGASVPISVDECADKVLSGITNSESYIHTDFIGWVLSCFSLGFGPRSWWLFQIPVAVIGVLFARLISKYHDYQVKQWVAANRHKQ
ncbi:hypothetical protein CAS74_003289 [Pichia kudriavzevii]|uniref:3-ketodihydrosphingosine reductase TSC10 n=1 Tax=Pichia kudriavzevii TaxID=4909 RepID=A0A1Z8JKR1_PICKU|nr:hypothetical protein CAS74_003289 [Pichia kudriavzevii]